MFQGKALVVKGACSECRDGAGAIAVQEIPTLNHKILDLCRYRQPGGLCSRFYQYQGVADPSSGLETHHTVEAAPLVTLWPAQDVLGLARTEAPEILRRLGHDVGVQKYLDTAERLACVIAVSSMFRC